MEDQEIGGSDEIKEKLANKPLYQKITYISRRHGMGFIMCLDSSSNFPSPTHPHLYPN
jgi:hypothetical protein